MDFLVLASHKDHTICYGGRGCNAGWKASVPFLRSVTGMERKDITYVITSDIDDSIRYCRGCPDPATRIKLPFLGSGTGIDRVDKIVIAPDIHKSACYCRG